MKTELDEEILALGAQQALAAATDFLWVPGNISTYSEREVALIDAAHDQSKSKHAGSPKIGAKLRIALRVGSMIMVMARTGEQKSALLSRVSHCM